MLHKLSKSLRKFHKIIVQIQQQVRYLRFRRRMRVEAERLNYERKMQAMFEADRIKIKKEMERIKKLKAIALG